MHATEDQTNSRKHPNAEDIDHAIEDQTNSEITSTFS
jgi:hypothetical protein